MSRVRVLSLFDGISAGRLALGRANIKVDTYYRAEIDKYANQVATHYYPDDVQLGDVTKWREWDIDWTKIDLLIGGSPCQGFSFAGKQLAFSDPRSKLFFEYVDILKHIQHVNPDVKFMLENVKMKKEFIDVINQHMGVKPVIINSALVSAQNRVRLYWCNWDVPQPNDKGILLRDILQTDVDDSYQLSKQRQNTILKSKRGKNLISADKEKIGTLIASYHKVPTDGYYIQVNDANMSIYCGAFRGRYNQDGGISQKLEIRQDEKTNSLTTVQKDNVITFVENRRISKNGLHFVGGIFTTNSSARLSDGKILSRNFKQGCRVYSAIGKAPTLNSQPTGGLAGNSPCLIEQMPYRPASIVGRRLNERGVRDDSNKDVPLTQCLQVKHGNQKMGCLTTVEKDCLVSKEDPGRYPDAYNRSDIHYRKLTPTECARLQTFPDGWAEDIVSKTQAYKSYGNSWTVDVIAHIFESAGLGTH